jgi:phosphatidylserine decarboxylase
MEYKDRQGNRYVSVSGQDRLLAAAYGSAAGRCVMKLFSQPIFSKISRFVLSARLSADFVPWFIRENNIDMFDYQKEDFDSFNDFFTRKIKSGRRAVAENSDALVSPSDGKVSAYEITATNIFVIKNSVYSVESLLRDKKLAERYRGGYALVVRLSVDDYHRYIYPCSGVKSHNRKIKGFLHTVNPVINRYIPVYKENSREYCLIRSTEFGDVVQMEVGAMMVGKITNHCGDCCRVSRGAEKGYFEFGGSTIVLLLENDKADVCEDLLKNTLSGYETKVRQGEILALSRK